MKLLVVIFVLISDDGLLVKIGFVSDLYNWIYTIPLYLCTIEQDSEKIIAYRFDLKKTVKKADAS